MARHDRSAGLAVGWIEAWVGMDLEWLRRHLAEDFVHESPFGRLAGRDHYLATVAPMARRSVTELRVVDVIAAEDRAVIRFENHTPAGVVETCDWIRVEGDRIVAIRSFYDSAAVRRVLDPDDQERLSGEETPGRDSPDSI